MGIKKIAAELAIAIHAIQLLGKNPKTERYVLYRQINVLAHELALLSAREMDLAGEEDPVGVAKLRKDQRYPHC
ncbi:hypothetical protein HY732_00015 [Candidatus Uhrbacteria bacterium]|nr:hypothetical protein [Candidatus Uhrbacteria bacterium]